MKTKSSKWSKAGKKAIKKKKQIGAAKYLSDIAKKAAAKREENKKKI